MNKVKIVLTVDSINVGNVLKAVKEFDAIVLACDEVK